MLLPIIEIVIRALAPHLPAAAGSILALAIANALVCADQCSLHGVLTRLSCLRCEPMRHDLIELLHSVKFLARRKHNLTCLQCLVRLGLLLALIGSVYVKNGTNELPAVNY